MRVYLDRSLREFDTVYPAGGDDHSAVKLTPDELYDVSGADDWGRRVQGVTPTAVLHDLPTTKPIPREAPIPLCEQSLTHPRSGRQNPVSRTARPATM